MLKETIVYTDYNGMERTEEFYFNLNKAEVLELELTTPGGFFSLIDHISKTNDVPEGVKFIKEFILKSYGVKSDDGRRFVKSPAISDEFEQTEAYSQLFIKLCTNPDMLSSFVAGVIPKDPDAEKSKILTPIGT